jgi:hypothetical protein
MRRKSEPLTVRELQHVNTTSAILFGAIATGSAVTFKYRKADGSQTDRSGVPLETLGADDTLSVRMDTPSGVRTFNVGGITHLRVSN